MIGGQLKKIYNKISSMIRIALKFNLTFICIFSFPLSARAIITDKLTKYLITINNYKLNKNILTNNNYSLTKLNQKEKKVKKHIK